MFVSYHKNPFIVQMFQLLSIWCVNESNSVININISVIKREAFCFLAECWMRRSIPLPCLYTKCEATVSNWLA